MRKAEAEAAQLVQKPGKSGEINHLGMNIRVAFFRMRKRFEPQIVLGQTPIEKVVLPTKSRDELPAVLAGLQWIYRTPQLNEAVFRLLEERIIGDKKPTGRPGMDLWHILVLGVVRLARGCDYDQLEHTANFDSLVRQIMGIATGLGAQSEPLFHHKTLSGNVCHIDEELLEKINVLVVEHGQPLLVKKTKRVVCA